MNRRHFVQAVSSCNSTGGNSTCFPNFRGRRTGFHRLRKVPKTPARDLEPVGSPASVLYYAGNISRQSGRNLTLDPNTETFIDDPEANRLRGRTEWPKPDILAKV